jgi:hypothetical protein
MRILRLLGEVVPLILLDIACFLTTCFVVGIALWLVLR